MSIPGTVPITGPIAPTDVSDLYPTHFSIYGLGGHREVADLVARDAISVDRRAEGMLCYVVSDGNTYQLQGGILNANWALFSAGGGSSSLQLAYDSSPVGNKSISLDSTVANQQLRVKDNVVPLVGNLFEITDSLSSAYYFAVQSGGVGIGVVPAAGANILQIRGGSTYQENIGSARYELKTFETAVLTASEFRLSKVHNLSYGTTTATINGEALGYFRFIGQASAFGQAIAATIYCQQQGAAGAGNVPGSLKFATAETASPVDRMVINANGTVGVGTTDPDATLDINGSLATNIQTQATNLVIGDGSSNNSVFTVLADAASQNVTITLPTPGNNVGRLVCVKKIDATANFVYVNVTGGGTVDGSTQWSTTTQWESILVQSNGTAWYII